MLFNICFKILQQKANTNERPQEIRIFRSSNRKMESFVILFSLFCVCFKLSITKGNSNSNMKSSCKNSWLYISMGKETKLCSKWKASPMTISHILKKSYLFTGVARPQILTFWDSHYIMGQNLETQKNKGVSGYQYVPEFRLLSLLLVVDMGAVSVHQVFPILLGPLVVEPGPVISSGEWVVDKTGVPGTCSF